MVELYLLLSWLALQLFTAMIASIGMIFQCAVFGEGPISQLSHLGSVYQIPSM
jgi:hypothetical protein